MRLYVPACVLVLALLLCSEKISAVEYSEEVRNSHIILYEHAGFQGARLTLRLRDGGYQEIDPANILHGRCSSFELNCPPNVMVTLCKHLEGQKEFPIDRKNFRPPDHLVDVGALSAASLNDAIKSLVWAVDNAQVEGRSKTGAEDDANRPPDPPRSPRLVRNVIPGSPVPITPPIKLPLPETITKVPEGMAKKMDEAKDAILPKANQAANAIQSHKDKVGEVVSALSASQDPAAKIAALGALSLSDVVSTASNFNYEDEKARIQDSIGSGLKFGDHLLDLADSQLAEMKGKADELTKKFKESAERIEAVKRIDMLQKRYLLDLKALLELQKGLKLPTVDDLVGQLDMLWPVKELPVFSLDTPLTIGCNQLAMTHFGEITLPQGMKYNYEQIKLALSGNVALPDVDWIQCMAEIAAGIKPRFKRAWDELDTVAASGIQGGRYFSSERWTKYASVETISSVAGKIYASGGDGAKDAARELELQCRLELSDMLAWAKLEGQNNLTALATVALKRLKNFDSWNDVVENDEAIKVAIRGAKVNYQLAAFGETSSPYAVLLSPGYEALKRSGFQKWEEKVMIPHFGFIVEAKVAQTVGANPMDRLQMFVKLADSTGGSGGVVSEIQGAINKAFELVAKTSATQSIHVTEDLIRSVDVAEIFKLLLTEIKAKASNPSKPINWKLDLSHTKVADAIAERARKLALGNAGDAKVESLSLDLATGRVDALIKVTHAYKWKGLRPALNDIDAAMKRADAGDMLKDNASDLVLDAIFKTAPPGARELLERLKIAVKVKALYGRISEIEKEVSHLFKRI